MTTTTHSTPTESALKLNGVENRQTFFGIRQNSIDGARSHSLICNWRVRHHKNQRLFLSNSFSCASDHVYLFKSRSLQTSSTLKLGFRTLSRFRFKNSLIITHVHTSEHFFLSKAKKHTFIHQPTGRFSPDYCWRIWKKRKLRSLMSTEEETYLKSNQVVFEVTEQIWFGYFTNEIRWLKTCKCVHHRLKIGNTEEKFVNK